jgi:hypothetical protein
VLYCRDYLGIPDDRLDVNGGAIAAGDSIWHVWLELWDMRCWRAVDGARVMQ